MGSGIEYDAINKGEEALIVFNKDGKEVVGIICQDEKYVVMDSWISKDNKYINAKVKFVNCNRQFVYGYLYNVSYVKQVSF